MQVGNDTSAAARHRLHWPERFDVLLVATLAIFYVVAFIASDVARRDVSFVIPLFAMTLLPLLWRSQAPVPVFMLVIALQWFVLAPLGVYRLPGGTVAAVVVLVALGAVAARSRLWISLLALAATFVSTVVSFTVSWSIDSLGWSLFVATVLCGIAWGLGAYAHRTRGRIRELQVHQQRAAEAVAAERSRVASELNDIITLAIDKMLEEVSVARGHFDRDRARAVEALAAIEATGVEAMHELRRLLHLLHDDPGFAATDPPEPKNDSRRARLAGRLLSIDGSDAAITIVVIVATMFLTAATFQGGMRMLASLFLGLTLCVLLWRHQFPVAVFILVITGNVAAILLFHNGDFIFDNQTVLPAALVALAAVAGGRPLWISIPVLVIAWAYGSVAALEYPANFRDSLVQNALFIGAIWMAALITGRRRRHIQELQAAQAAAQQAVDSERARLAYELHDVIGHSITIMVLQAAGARRIMDQDPTRAATALPPIEESGLEARRELKRLLALLGENDSNSPDMPSEPPRKLADIDQLIERAKRTVTKTELEVIGTPGHLEPSVDAAAYCVAREALANAAKHAGPDAHIGITVSWLPEAVRVEVTSGSGSRSPVQASDLSGGYGLLSLQERVGLAGGELHWSPEGNKFNVDARFPVAASDHQLANPVGE